MSDKVIYEPRPPYVVQVGERSLIRGVGPYDPSTVAFDWMDRSYAFDEAEAIEEADKLALDNALVRVIDRSEA